MRCVFDVGLSEFLHFRIYRKAALKEKKEVTYQVMTKGKRGRLSRPTGLYKVC